MKNIRINGQESGLRGDGLPRVVDVIELIKNSIDPDHMITSILVDGRELTDDEWTATTNRFETSVIEIETGEPREFVSTRLAASSAVVQSCFMEFRDARKLFKAGKMQDANQRLIEGVNCLQAFFEWYGTMLELLDDKEREEYSMQSIIDDVAEVCKKICQQQLYQSWWALAETLENQLEPLLDQMEDKCSTFAH
ncbi:MAG: hypothetical protein KDD62_13710 [Bdellovibrionales bacterium]|nr:hypothetical protein [Bdellovibrionales bacterium]